MTDKGLNAVSFDTESSLLDSTVSDVETSSLQEEILAEIQVTNGLLGTICAFLFFFALALVSKMFFSLIKNNVTRHIR